MKDEELSRVLSAQCLNTRLMLGMLHEYDNIDADMQTQKTLNLHLAERLTDNASSMQKLEQDTASAIAQNNQLLQRLDSLEKEVLGQKRRINALQDDSDRRFLSLFAKTDLQQKKINEFFPYSTSEQRADNAPQLPGALQSRLRHDMVVESLKKQKHVNLLTLSLAEQEQERKKAIEHILKCRHQCKRLGTVGAFLFKDTREYGVHKRFHVFNSYRAWIYRFYKSFTTLECALRYRDDVLRILGLKLVIEQNQYFLEVA